MNALYSDQKCWWEEIIIFAEMETLSLTVCRSDKNNIRKYSYMRMSIQSSLAITPTIAFDVTNLVCHGLGILTNMSKMPLIT